MARVVITVEREGGSTIKIAECSAMPLFTDDQTVMLVQEAFIRTCRALGVQERPDPKPPTPAPAAVTVQDPPDGQADAVVAEALSKTNRKAA